MISSWSMDLPADLGMLPPCQQACCIYGVNRMDKEKWANCCRQSIPCRKCPSHEMCHSWMEYVDKHCDIRRYAHFGGKLSLRFRDIRKYVMNRDKVAVHSFYPFIHFQKKNIRFHKIPDKQKTKIRELYYCSHLDRCVYQRYAFLLNYYYDIWVKTHGFDAAAVAYRAHLGKNNIDLVKGAFDAVRGTTRCFIWVGDLENFFDKLDHQYLKEMVCKVLETSRLPADFYAVFKNITKFSSIDWGDVVKAAGESLTTKRVRSKLNAKKQILTREEFRSCKSDIKVHNSRIGIPQGSPISAVLANVYMIEFDQRLYEYVKKHKGLYMRYSDDLFIMIPYESLEDIPGYLENIHAQIGAMGGKIQVQKEKTKAYVYTENTIYAYEEITDLKPDKIDYLGFIFDGRHIRVRPRSITKYYYRMRRKAHTIGRMQWRSPKGRHIVPHRLYRIYSAGGRGRQTYIDYLRRAEAILELQDPEARALLRGYKRKIKMAIHEAE